LQISTSSSKRILSIVLITGILIGILIVSINYIQNETEKKIQESLIASTFERQQETTKRISMHISSDLELISEKIELTASLLGSGDFTTKPVLDSLMKLYDDLNSKTSVGWIFILDEDGVVISSINPDGATVHKNKIDLSYRDYFIHTKTELEPYLTNGFLGINDIPLIISANPILNSDGKFIGMIGASLDTNNFFKQYGNSSDPSDDLFIVIGSDKNFITNPNPDLVGKNVLEEKSLRSLDSEGISLYFLTKFYDLLI